MLYDVIIVGGGIIGLTTAYYLYKNGFKVSILERGRLGCEASRNNAGFIVPSMYSPLPLEASIANLIKWILSRKSPVWVSAKELFNNWRWFMHFLTAKSNIDPEACRTIRKLCRDSLNEYTKLIDTYGIDCDLRKGCILEVYSDKGDFEEAKLFVGRLWSEGFNVKVLSNEEIYEIEPELNRILVGGLLYEEDLLVDSAKFINGLSKVIKSLGIDICEHTEVTKILARNDIVSVYTGIATRLDARYVVISAGPWSIQLLKNLGLNLLMRPARGYTITLSKSSKRLNNAIFIHDIHEVVLSRSDGAVKVSSILEFMGFNKDISVSKATWMVNSAAKYIPYIKELSIEDIWVGLRPCTADGIPVIGKIPGYDNIILATGHCRFGLTFSILTAKLITDILKGKAKSNILKIFSPMRMISS